MTVGLDSRWLVGALPGSLIFLGPASHVEIAVEPGWDALAALDALTPALDGEGLSAALDATAADLAQLVDQLTTAGVLVDGDGAEEELEPPAVRLAGALLDVVAGRSLTTAGRAVVVTAEEALVLPAGLDAQVERAALRAFVAGVGPDRRLDAYCQVATTRLPVVRGDLPSAEALAAAVAPGLDDGRVHVLDLIAGSAVAVDVERIGALGFDAPHRLGPLAAAAPLVRPGGAGANGMCVYVATHALANLRYPTSADDRIGGGRAPEPRLAELIARAEAAERYASGDLGPHELVRARGDDLDAPAVVPGELYRRNARQLRDSPVALIEYLADAEHLWVEGETPGGQRRWVPADGVFYPFDDPVRGGRTVPTGSSGSAAHSTFAAARERALCELVERDAFMWTWVQRVPRELIEASSLPVAQRERADAIVAAGLEVVFVNLTLDLLPVIACVVSSHDRFAFAMACSLDVEEAVRRSLDEAIGLIEMIDRGRLERVDPEEVRTPHEHAALALDPHRIERNRLLFGGSDERVALDELTLPDADPDELLARVGEPVTVDLTSPATAPFHVARVVVPGLVPVSFGYDHEPLGMPRLAEPRRTHDGRRLGVRLDLAEAGPLDPHPFA